MPDGADEYCFEVIEGPQHTDSPRRAPVTKRGPVLALVVSGLLAAALLLGACSGSNGAQIGQRDPESGETGSETPGDPDTSDAPETTEDSAPTARRDPLVGNGNSVRIVFGGDASFEGLEGALQGDTSTLLGAIAPTFAAGDLGVANLEAALTTGGTPAPKTFNFRVPPAALDALASANISVVSQANNHGMDYGQDGFAETLTIKATSPSDHGVDVIGVGSSADEAVTAVIKEVNGQRIAILAASDVFDSSLESSWTATDTQGGMASAREGQHQDRLLEAIAEVRDEVDTVVVYLHMGREKDLCPTERQVSLGDSLHSGGADLVIGTHAHRLQGAGFRNGRFVAYGLGNFVFKAPSAESAKVGVLSVDVTGRRVDGFEWTPARIVNSLPVPLSGADADAALAELDERRQCANLELEPPAEPPVGATSGDGEQ